MEKQLDLVTKAKKQLIKLEYIEINIKSRCSIRNMIGDDVDLSLDCKYDDDDFPFPIFLYNYLSRRFNPNPIERIISLNYKQEDYVYNLKLEDIPKSVFFSKNSINLVFYNDIRCLIGGWANNEYCDKNGKENLDLISELYPSYGLHDGKGFEEVVVVFENFDDIEKCEFSISYPVVFSKIFKSKAELREVEALIIKEILESVPYAKPKNLANYRKKSLIFYQIDMNIIQSFVDINKAYLGQNVENIYNLLLKENYNFAKKPEFNQFKMYLLLKLMKICLKNLKNTELKKLNLNIENRDKFILSWFDKFHRISKVLHRTFWKRRSNLLWSCEIIGQIKSNLIYLLQILFGPKYWIEELDFYPDKPDFYILPSWAKLKLENFEIFYFGGKNTDFFDEIISQFDSKKPVFWFKPYYYSAYGAGDAWILPIALKNFILLYVDGEKIYYWFGHSNLYNNIYQGKYEILKYYFKQKLVKLEQDIFLRDGNDPTFFVSRPLRQNNLIKNVICQIYARIKFLYRDALNKYLKETDHEFGYFTDFLENTNLYTQQEKELILQPHLLFLKILMIELNIMMKLQE
nr:hypothetical protein [Mesomycoplasma ovipneumoniae]